MNLIGKIFIVLIFIMTLVFMGLAVSVYSKHQNWYLQAEALKKKLNDAEQANIAEKEEHNKLRDAITAELTKKKKEFDSLNTQYTDLVEENKTAVTDRDDYKKKIEEQLATLATEGENLKALTAELEKLRGEIRLAQADRDKMFKANVGLTDDNAQADARIVALTARAVDLSAQIAMQKKLIESAGLTINTTPSDVPPKMQGKVLAMNAEKMIEISLGSDDGLKVGHTLEVYRANKYLGRVEVMSITFNRAVAKIVPGYQQGIIQKGDDVATRLKVS